MRWKSGTERKIFPGEMLAYTLGDGYPYVRFGYVLLVGERSLIVTFEGKTFEWSPTA